MRPQVRASSTNSTNTCPERPPCCQSRVQENISSSSRPQVPTSTGCVPRRTHIRTPGAAEAVAAAKRAARRRGAATRCLSVSSPASGRTSNGATATARARRARDERAASGARRPGDGPPRLSLSSWPVVLSIIVSFPIHIPSHPPRLFSIIAPISHLRTRSADRPPLHPPCILHSSCVFLSVLPRFLSSPPPISVLPPLAHRCTHALPYFCTRHTLSSLRWCSPVIRSSSCHSASGTHDPTRYHDTTHDTIATRHELSDTEPSVSARPPTRYFLSS